MATPSEPAGDLPLHPYYPLGVAIPHYVANDMSTAHILGYFGVGCGAILLATYLVSRRLRPGLSGRAVATVMWLVLSGCIHLGMEGYVVFNSATVAGLGTVLGQAWKEYAHSDSRYLTQDSFVVTMEAVTAVLWGPLCLVVAGLALCGDDDDNNGHPLRHPLQIVLCLGQLYGDVLYYATCAFEHAVRQVVYCRGDGYYFWAYFVGLNAIWVAIPLPLMVHSIRETGRAFARAKQVGKPVVKQNGKVD